MKNKIILLFFVSIIFQFYTWSEGHNWGGDFASYIMQAISISDGTVEKFIYQNNLAMTLSSSPMGPVNYPWGFPIMLSPIYSVFGFDIIFFKTLVLIFFISFLIIILKIFKSELDDNEQLVYLGIFALNPYLLKFGDSILSDIPFLFFSTLSIYLINKLNKETSPIKVLILSSTIGLIFMWSTNIRTNGLLLPISYVIFVLLTLISKSYIGLRKLNLNLLELENFSLRIKIAVYIFPIIFFLLSNWYFLEIISNNQETHFDFLNRINFKTILINLTYYSIIIKDFFGPSYYGASLYIASIPFVILGLKNKWRSSIFIIIYTFLTLALYVIWPFKQGLRFLFPILPFYIYFFVIGLRELDLLNNKLNIKKKINIFLILSFFLISSFQIYNNYNNNFKLKNGPYSKNSIEMFDVIKTNVGELEVVIFRKPRVMTLFTTKKSIIYTNIKDFKKLNWYVVDKDNFMNIDLKRDILFKKNPAIKYYENNQFIIYKFL